VSVALRKTALVLLASVALLALGCVSSDKPPEQILPETKAAKSSAPLAGEALRERKRELQRAHKDITHFQETLASLKYRKERNGLVQFSHFLDSYLGMHLHPLLEGEWQSRHPELAALDANVRFAEAELLLHLQDRGRAEDAMDEIQKRFAGREDMLVAYPVGKQTPLGKALKELRERKWSG
jgi:hypothetical protein